MMCVYAMRLFFHCERKKKPTPLINFYMTPEKKKIKLITKYKYKKQGAS